MNDLRRKFTIGCTEKGECADGQEMVFDGLMRSGVETDRTMEVLSNLGNPGCKEHPTPQIGSVLRGEHSSRDGRKSNLFSEPIPISSHLHSRFKSPLSFINSCVLVSGVAYLKLLLTCLRRPQPDAYESINAWNLMKSNQFSHILASALSWLWILSPLNAICLAFHSEPRFWAVQHSVLPPGP